MTPAVRPLEPRDFDAWLPLWHGYNSFYHNEVEAEVTENTFRRLHENSDGFFGLVAEHDSGLVGLAHAIFHPSTWTTRSYCYLPPGPQLESKVDALAGLRGYWPGEEEFAWQKERGITSLFMHEVRDLGIGEVLGRAIEVAGTGPVFLTVGIDVLDPAFALARGRRNPAA